MPRHFAGSLQDEIKWLDLEGFEYLCFNLAREFLTFNEPIPDYSTCDIPLLDSALGAPRASFGGKMLYPKFEQQVAVLFYSLIKNHPFKNGNKRIAVMSVLTFLNLNNKWINISPENFYEIAFLVSESSRHERDKIIKILVSELNKSIIEW